MWMISANSVSVKLRMIVCRYCKAVLTEDDDGEKQIASVLIIPFEFESGMNG